ncbi:MAG: 30S ribosomal protein S4e [Candidatus Diapherotrites archaeon]|nr:30S ribosomal protein S4e [Candidatus Diapherotrites archaeon]
MSSKGENKKQKTISTAKIRFLKRKEKIWTIKNRTGPHSQKTSVPLGFVVRDMLGLAETKKEIRIILNGASVQVNGTVRKDLKFPVGLFDIVSFPQTGKMYRIMLDKNGRIKVTEMGQKASLEKVSKILKKHVKKNGKIILTTSEGFVLLQGKHKISVSDSVKISLPEKKILQHFPLSDGMVALIIGGKHAGQVVTVKAVIEGSMHKPKLVKTQTDQGEFETLEKYVCVVGDRQTAEQMSIEGA